MTTTKVTITYTMKHIEKIPPKQGYETYYGNLVQVNIDEQKLLYSEIVEFDSSLGILAISNEVTRHILQRQFKHNLLRVYLQIEGYGKPNI